jgi:AbrB family looped-hinge helix DNA binding protein
MATTLTGKGQVTIPKHILDALGLQPGSKVEFSVNAGGELVLRTPRRRVGRTRVHSDRFDAVRGQAEVRWRTDDLMGLLRPDC